MKDNLRFLNEQIMKDKNLQNNRDKEESKIKSNHKQIIEDFDQEKLKKSMITSKQICIFSREVASKSVQDVKYRLDQFKEHLLMQNEYSTDDFYHFKKINGIFLNKNIKELAEIYKENSKLKQHLEALKQQSLHLNEFYICPDTLKQLKDHCESIKNVKNDLIFRLPFHLKMKLIN